MIADFILGSKGFRSREGVEVEKRVHFFKGSKLIQFLMTNKSKAKRRPNVATRADAVSIGKFLIKHGFIHRSVKDETKRNTLKPVKEQTFEADGYYTWMYEGSKTTMYFMSMALVVGFFGCVLMPIWPMWAKLAVYYVSVVLLILMLGIMLIRLVVFLFCWAFGYSIWIYPNLMDETLGVVDSFRPVISFEPSSGNRWLRFAYIVVWVGFIYWLSEQPNEMESFLRGQRQIIDDIYSARVLDFRSQEEKETIDKPRIPTVEDLLAADEDEDEAANEARLDEIMNSMLEEDIEGEAAGASHGSVESGTSGGDGDDDEGGE